jgi:hypothetical protein
MGGLLGWILGLQDGFGEPGADIELAPVPGGFQVVQAEPGRGLEEPGARHLDAAAVGGVPAQEHLLRDVLGGREGAGHAVGEPDQLGAERAVVLGGIGLARHGQAAAAGAAGAGAAAASGGTARKPMASRFQPLIVTMSRESFTISSSVKCGFSPS